MWQDATLAGIVVLAAMVNLPIGSTATKLALMLPNSISFIAGWTGFLLLFRGVRNPPSEWAPHTTTHPEV